MKLGNSHKGMQPGRSGKAQIKHSLRRQHPKCFQALDLTAEEVFTRVSQISTLGVVIQKEILVALLIHCM